MENRKFRTRECKECKKEFESRGNSVKFCSKECGRKNYVALNREKLKVSSLFHTNKFHKEKRELIRALKLKTGCKDCGYNKHPAALDFDHVRGEKVCEVSHCTTKEKLLEEIAKCEVVCATCHRIRTYNRRENKKAGREVIINIDDKNNLASVSVNYDCSMVNVTLNGEIQ